MHSSQSQHNGQKASGSFPGQERAPLMAAQNMSFYPSNFSSPAEQGYHPNYLNGGAVSGHHEGPLSFFSAFGVGNLGDEPPLLEELGINLSHIRYKTLAVLKPIQKLDKHIMDDTDLAGPLLFCILFGVSLMLVGKIHFGYIYGVALMGWASIYGILNAMSDQGVDMLRTASVLGYCLLPMVILSCLSLVLPLQGLLGLLFSLFIVFWCTISSSNMFVAALSMREQRVLVAYPVGLFYFCFALMTLF